MKGSNVPYFQVKQKNFRVATEEERNCSARLADMATEVTQRRNTEGDDWATTELRDMNVVCFKIDSKIPIKGHPFKTTNLYGTDCLLGCCRVIVVK